MKCRKCDGEVDEYEGRYAKDKSGGICEKCFKELEAVCCLCDSNVGNKPHTFFENNKFLCGECVIGVKEKVSDDVLKIKL